MAAVDTNQYLTVPDYATNSALAAQQNMRIETLSRIRRTLVTDRPRCVEDCVVWARYVSFLLRFRQCPWLCLFCAKPLVSSH